MRCPFCGSENSQVKDSRPSDENSAIRRRRVCSDCSGRFTTFERVELTMPIVVGRGAQIDRLRDGDRITLVCHAGPDGVVYPANGVVPPRPASTRRSP